MQPTEHFNQVAAGFVEDLNGKRKLLDPGLSDGRLALLL
jgi:hypothetical protein